MADEEKQEPVLEQKQPDNMEQYYALMQAEQDSLQTYLDNIFINEVPKPEAPTDEDKSFWRIAGTDAVLYTASSLGAMIFSAIRTGGFFYILELALLNKFDFITDGVRKNLSSLAFIMALLAFEGYLLADGYAKGRGNKGIKISKQGFVSAFAVVITASVFSSFGLTSLPEWLQITINVISGLVTALAAGFVVVAGGENIGYTFNLVENERTRLMKKYTDDLAAWRGLGTESYRTSRYNIHRKDGYLAKGSQLPSQSKVSEKENSQEPSHNEEVKKKVKVSEIVKNYVNEFVKTNNRLPTGKEIKANIDASDAIIYYAACEYVVENEQMLRDGGFATEDDINKSKLALEKRKASTAKSNEKKKQTP